MEKDRTLEAINTGEICRISGVYKCLSHPDCQMNMSEGRTVLPCYKHFPGHSTTWLIVSASNSPMEVKQTQWSVFSRLFSRGYWVVLTGLRR